MLRERGMPRALQHQTASGGNHIGHLNRAPELRLERGNTRRRHDHMRDARLGGSQQAVENRAANGTKAYQRHLLDSAWHGLSPFSK